MAQTIKNIATKFVIFLMIGIMGMFIANQALYVHAHKMADGTIVQHAHPYHKSDDGQPFKTHHHTKAEIFFLQNLQILFVFTFFTLALIDPAKRAISFALPSQVRPQVFVSLHHGRAPPLA
ncbi:MAG: hypothetical protein WC271_07390 [Bacteroidales bacterium]|jgi:hypothetical protein|nr:hypothetical protein [Bacteroidales bacterium]MDD4175689.1 hypothetical protein [Bacteroidales bacterium]NCU36020.1 hypothetical protein [Candidatus Falkowbacteria bacterium]